MEKTDSARATAIQLGFWSAVLMAAFAAVALAIAIATPPISGPFCRSGCVSYPYAGVAAFVPHDYIWMYPGILLTPLFVVLVASIHSYARPDKKVFSRIALSFALISAVAITMDYFIQLTVIQPSLLKGETEGLALFSQYNPHGVFIALEDLGYLMMSLAFLFMAGAFAGNEGLLRAIRWLFILGALLVFAAFIVLSLVFGNNLEYRFEVFVITINWIILIAAGVLLAALFRRALKQGAP